MSWGHHLHLDCAGCLQSFIKDEQIIRCWLEDLLKRIHMEPTGPTMLEHTAMHDPDKAGYTLMQCIQTSSITAHFVDSRGDAYIDVFSCKDFSTAEVEECVRSWFGPLTMKSLRLERQA